MIGSSRPMVSKLLTEMTERGILIREGRRHILLTAAKPVDAVPSAREAKLHPAFEPHPRRVRAERRATRGNPATTVNL
jgi:Mn-dependent DtxR family transcriptional regulator